MSQIDTFMNTLASQVQFTAGSVYSSNAYSVAMALGFRFANERVNGVPTDPERFARYEANTESMIENAVNLIAQCPVSDDFDGRPVASDVIDRVIAALKSRIDEEIEHDPEVAEILEAAGVNVEREVALRHSEREIAYETAVRDRDALVASLKHALSGTPSESFVPTTRQQVNFLAKAVTAMQRKLSKLAEQYANARDNRVKVNILADMKLLPDLIDQAIELESQIGRELEAETDVIGEVH